MNSVDDCNDDYNFPGDQWNPFDCVTKYITPANIARFEFSGSFDENKL